MERYDPYSNSRNSHTVLELATAVVELGGAAATCAQLAEECLARCFMARSAIGK